MTEDTKKTDQPEQPARQVMAAWAPVIFADGAKGYAIQTERDTKNGIGLTRSSVRQDRRSGWVTTYHLPADEALGYEEQTYDASDREQLLALNAECLRRIDAKNQGGEPTSQ